MSEGTIVETPTGKQGRVVPAPPHADPDGPRVWVRVTLQFGPHRLSIRVAYHPRDLREVPHA